MDAEIMENPPNTPVATETTKCKRKCVRKGNRICYSDTEGMEVLKKIPEEISSIKTGESESVTNVNNLDSIHSGESLFKTFTFDVDDNSPDMLKCMAFWKCVLDKSLTPVRCTLGEKKSKKSEPKCNEAEATKLKEIEEAHNQMWIDAFQEIQKKRLDEVKLGKKNKCDICAIPDTDEVGISMKKEEEKEDIKKLNQWKAKKEVPHKRISISRVMAKPAKSSASTPRVKSATSKIQNKTLNNKVEKESEQTQEQKNEELQKSKINISKQKVMNEKNSQDFPPQDNPSHEDEKLSCCICGCCIDQCVCDAIAEITPCSCGCGQDECICKELEKLACTCGCSIMDCICQQSLDTTCKCGCGLGDCICENIIKKTCCTCGCGLEDCNCDDALAAIGKKCLCGNPDCQCDEIFAQGNQYLQEKLMAEQKILELVIQQRTANVGVQSCGPAPWSFEMNPEVKKGTYCAICGHFNCYCKSKQTSN